MKVLIKATITKQQILFLQLQIFDNIRILVVVTTTATTTTTTTTTTATTKLLLW